MHAIQLRSDIKKLQISKQLFFSETLVYLSPHSVMTYTQYVWPHT